ncbi:putative 1-acyl-sn-glycerol-3-phosphate acyltransferase [Yarrowia sp. B02]|nr:putative 1-acyl-sn-glycerol-3-phosphate acyltransferase [Yarrowia sp. B02]
MNSWIYVAVIAISALLVARMSVASKLVFYVRAAIAVIIFAACATYGVLASTILTAIGKQGLAQWTVARAFYHSVRLLLGISIKLRSREVSGTAALDPSKISVADSTKTIDDITKFLPRPCVLISNHQNEMDILVLGRIFPQYCSVTAKKALKWYPLLGQFMALSGTIFLDRKDRNKSVQTLSGAVKTIQSGNGGKGQNVFMFPEGTRSYSKDIGIMPFKKGCFHLAVQSGAPIVPVVVQNTSRMFSFGQGKLDAGEIIVDVLSPIETKGLDASNVDALMATTYKAMVETADKIGYAGAKK